MELDAAVLLDVAHRGVDHAEVAQPEEVHLHQAHLLALRVGEAGDDHAVLVPLVHGEDVEQRLVGDDERAGVYAGLADQALDPATGVDDLVDVRVALVQSPELAALGEPLVVRVEQVVQRNVLAHHGSRHGLGDLLAERERVAQDAARVLDRGLRLDRAERVHLARVRLAVLVRHVADDLVALAVVEVEVDVRRGDALGVEEPLEQQSVLHGVHFDDLGEERHHRSGGRAATRPHRDPVLARITADVGDDEEVRRVAHRLDDAHLELDAIAEVGRRAVAEPLANAVLDLLAQPRGLRLPRRHVELRHPVDLAEDVGVVADPLRDRERVVAGLGHLTEQRPHLLGGLDVVAVAVEPEPVRVVLVATYADAQEVVVGVELVGGDVVGVVGGQQRQVEVLRDPQEVVTDVALDGQPVVHELRVEVLGPEDVAVRGRSGQRLVVLAKAKPGLDLARRAAGRRDDALAVLGEQLAVHARLQVEALEAREARQPEQVAQAFGILRPHRHVRVATAARDILGALGVEVGDLALAGRPELRNPGEPGRRGHVGLDPDDRLDGMVLRRVPELVRPEHVAVVGHRHRTHALTSRLGHQRPHLRGTVEHRVLGVYVEVDEVRAHRSSSLRAQLTARCRVLGRRGKTTTRGLFRTPGGSP